MALFNPNWKPSGMDAVRGSVENGLSAGDYNYAGAFSGIPGLQNASLQGDKFKLYKNVDSNTQDVAQASIGQNGAVNIGNWQRQDVASAMDGFKEFAPVLLAAATFGGMAGVGPMSGLFNGAAAGSGAASGAGFVGEGALSGIPAWDAAATTAGLGGSGAAAGAGFIGEGATSGVPAWDGATGSGSGLLNGAKDLIGKVPGRVWSSIGGGLLGGSGSQQPPAYTGPMPTITQGDWKASVKPKYMPLVDVSKLVNWG